MGYLRSYFELYEMYRMVDKSGDRRVSKDEFCAAGPMLASWGLVAEDGAALDEAQLAEVFAKADADGGGMILFTEFADWAISNKLDLGEEDNRPIAGPAKTEISCEAYTTPMPAYSAAPVTYAAPP